MISFLILAVLISALAAISCTAGSESAYSSLPMLLLWGALAVSAVYVIVRRRLYRRPVLFLLHVAFLIIIAGAAVTHFTGRSSTMHLRQGEATVIGDMRIALVRFDIDYYPGTEAPADFISTLDIDGTRYTVSMNKVLSKGGYRFFQTAYDPDRMGTTLTVTQDLAGTIITYGGYALLLTMMILYFIPRRKVRRSVAAVFVLFIPYISWASPEVLPADVAARFGNLYVYHNDRVAPLSTFAHDFSLKLTGSTSYGGLSPEQVLTGWLFFYDSWKEEPCIKIKDKDTRKEFGGADRVALTDFFDAAGYRFADDRHAEANEKFSLASSATTGVLWRIFPCRNDRPGNSLTWLSPVDNSPEGVSVDDWHVMRHSLNYLAELVAHRQWNDVGGVVEKLERFQYRQADGALPTPVQTGAERLFISLASSPVSAIVTLVAGLLLLVWQRPVIAVVAASVSDCWIVLLIVLNWIASRHLPMSNGYETMQWLALSAVVIALALHRRYRAITAMGLVVAGLALAVAVMGQRNPQVTQLMPVLNSPLLSIHVLTVMLAYALLALMALAGVMWLCGRRDMLPLARRMLCPAVFLLAAGIFIGAVWANMSWGRYWGWDPKEVWALITMLVYCFPLHGGIMHRLARPRMFAWWCVTAFSCVLMTYFGVNYVLGGLHGYA